MVNPVYLYSISSMGYAAMSALTGSVTGILEHRLVEFGKLKRPVSSMHKKLRAAEVGVAYDLFINLAMMASDVDDYIAAIHNYPGLLSLINASFILGASYGFYKTSSNPEKPKEPKNRMEKITRKMESILGKAAVSVPLKARADFPKDSELYV